MVSAIQVAELSVSSVIHMLYGLYLFSSAVAGDLTQTLSESIFKSKTTIEVKRIDQEKTTNVNDLPPIVLVHGIFGFGKGVSSKHSFLYYIKRGFLVCWLDSPLQRLGGLSYFAGAEKKDERVLVPDLGSLTSVHDRWKRKFQSFLVDFVMRF